MGFHRGPTIVRDGLVLYLDAANPKSYPGSGTTWNDLSGNGNNGTLINGPTFSTDNNGNIVFDGVNDSVTILNPSNLLTTYNESITYETNIYIPSSSTWSNGFFGNIISRGTYGGFNGLGKSSIDNVIVAYYRGNTSGVAQATSTITRDTWYHCVSIWNGTSALLYINGELKSISTVELVGGPEETLITIGGARALGGNVGLPFEGEITFIKIYNRALTPEEIQQNYNATKGRFNL